MKLDLSFHALMVTEDRAPISCISMASFLAQSRRTKADVLHLIAPQDQVNDYFKMWRGCDWSPGYLVDSSSFSYELDEYSVPDPRKPPHRVPCTMNKAQSLLWGKYEEVGNDSIAMVWDDDDIAPRDRISRTFSAIATFHPRPVIASYSRGWFVNARTLYGYLCDLPPGRLWGGCLAWNAAVGRDVSFRSGVFPGQDRAFVDDAVRFGALRVFIEAPEERLPIALCHDKNVASFYQEKGEPMEQKLQDWLPDSVFSEVKKFQKFCVDRRIFPPMSE